jgi:hypothetical protein
MASEAGAGGEAVASALGKSPSSDNQLEAASYKQHHHHHHRTTAVACSTVCTLRTLPPHPTQPLQQQSHCLIACHGMLAPMGNAAAYTDNV